MVIIYYADYTNFQYYIKINFVIDYADYTDIQTTLIFNSTWKASLI